MGFLGKADEFFAAPGASVGSFVGNALHNASNFVCQLHYSTPGVIFDLSPFNRELWKELCKDRPSGLPPAPQPPFTGGQCPIPYSVQITTDEYNIDGSIYGANVKYSLRVFGPVKSVGTRVLAGSSNPNQIGVYASGAVEESYDVAANFQPYLSAPPYREFRNYRISAVTPLSGSDNCGNPPVSVQPVVLPVEQRTTIINVTSVDNSQYGLTAIVDFPSTSVDFDLSVPLRVTIDNRKFYLNIDGWYTGEPGDYSPPDLTPVQDNITHVQNTLNQYFSPVNPSVDNTLVLISPSGGKPSDEQESVPGAAWLIVDLTKLPDKAQYGGDSPTVYFAGWLEFLKEGRAFPRQQINFEQSIFRFPDGADGYAYTFTNGAQGNVSVYVEESQ